jgi:general secretion pathway protein C
VVACIFATLAHYVLFFVSGPEPAGEAASLAPRATGDVVPRAASINAIIARNLFGVAGKTDAANAAPTVETRLPLELRGVFVGERPEDSSAIVAQKGKTGESFIIGEILPGNAELVAVHTDHIVLRRAGNLESLRFPQSGKESLVPQKPQRSFSRNSVDKASDAKRAGPRRANRRAPNARTNQTTPREFVEKYAEKLKGDPEGVIRELGLSPVSAGSSDGYRLGNLANSPYLSQTGLQPGDVILSVNGQAVGDIQRDRQQIEGLLQQGSARLEVQRGTRRFFVSASLR